MKKVLVILVAAMALGMSVMGAASGSYGWRVVKSKTISGQFTVTAFNATVNHPRALAVRLKGQVQDASLTVACSRGFTVSGYNKNFPNHAGLYRVPIKPRGASSCDLVAGFASSGGKATMQILKR